MRLKKPIVSNVQNIQKAGKMKTSEEILAIIDSKIAEEVQANRDKRIIEAVKNACKEALKKSGKCDLLDNEIDFLIDNCDVTL